MATPKHQEWGQSDKLTWRSVMFDSDNDEIDYGCTDDLPLAEHIEWQHLVLEEDQEYVMDNLDDLEQLFF
jgi:hypothetical protein